MYTVPWPSESVPGVYGVSKFTSNNVRIRGSSPFPKEQDVYKIITVGGSTTAVHQLDDTETWTKILMNELLGPQAVTL
jgi:hypothetical protein